jgi:hypothetical protein
MEWPGKKENLYRPPKHLAAASLLAHHHQAQLLLHRHHHPHRHPLGWLPAGPQGRHVLQQQMQSSSISSGSSTVQLQMLSCLPMLLSVLSALRCSDGLQYMQLHWSYHAVYASCLCSVLWILELKRVTQCRVY